MGDPTEARTFLEQYLAGVPEEPERYFYLFDLATKRSRSYPTRQSAIVEAAARSEGAQDRYIGVSLAAGPLGPYQRVRNDNAAGIVGVYADIDVSGPAHRKPNLPPTVNASLELLLETEAPPTVLVDSGHGLQGWWLFHQAWMFSSRDDVDGAATLTKSWVDGLRHVAARHGWDVDPVGDLARMLRLPGTVNCKLADSPAPVRLLISDGPRYLPEELARRAVLVAPAGNDGAATVQRPSSQPVNWSTLHADAEPPTEKLERLLISPKARASYDHSRDDLQDQSASAYDLSLASMAVTQGWQDEEIIALLVSSRRRNRKPLKLRADYYERTLDAARRGNGPAASSPANADSDNHRMSREIESRGVVPVLAEELESEHFFATDGNGVLYHFDGGVYAEAARWLENQTRSLLQGWAATKKWRPTIGRELQQYLGAPAPRLWQQPPLHLLNVTNGVLDLTTGELHQHSPDHLSTVQLPVRYDPDASCPNVDDFVRDVFPEDAFATAFELIAYVMAPDPSHQKAVLLLGAGGNGKSVYLRLMQAFIGRANYSTVPLQRLEAERFSGYGLVGKLANICADLPASDLKGSAMFKSITGGDTITVERKYHDPTDAQLTCKLVFSANTPPRTPDASPAFFDRWVVIAFNRTFRGEATELPSRILDARLQDSEELSGVLNRAVHAWRKLHEHGLSEPLSLITAKEEFRQATDPVSVWLTKRTAAVPGAYISKRQLFDEYNADSIRRGRATMTAQAFGRAVRRSAPNIKDAQRTLAGRPVEVWTEITWRSANDDHVAEGGVLPLLGHEQV